MKKIFIAIAALVMAVSIMVLGSSQPASAGWPCDNLGVCGTVRHFSPDHGYDAPIAIRCNFGEGPTKFVYEGQSSKLRCHDTDEIYIRDNEELKCLYNTPEGTYWQTKFDAQGWHKITDAFDHTCLVQRD